MFLDVMFSVSTHAAGLALPVQTIQGSAMRTPLVELFTSEGCSSCPPADRFLSTLVNDPRLWHDFIPLAFHVDYWDQLGWRDRFSSSDNTARQHRLAQGSSGAGVYTPGFFVDASEWRGFFVGAPLRPPLGKVMRQSPGMLSIDVSGNGATVKFASAPPPADGQPSSARRINLALLGFGLSTNVRGGENGGRLLHHDFVVLSVQQQPLQADGAHFTLVAPPTARGAQRFALVSWVTDTDRPQPVQAVGGWLHTSGKTL